MNKDTKQKKEVKKIKKRKPIINFFGIENDEVKIQRQIAEKGRIGGVRVG